MDTGRRSNLSSRTTRAGLQECSDALSPGSVHDTWPGGGTLEDSRAWIFFVEEGGREDGFHPTIGGRKGENVPTTRHGQ